MRNLNATVVNERHRWICTTLFRSIKPEENGIQNLKLRYKMQSLIAMYSQYPEKGKVKFNCPRLRTTLHVFALFFHFLLPSLAMPWFAFFLQRIKRFLVEFLTGQPVAPVLALFLAGLLLLLFILLIWFKWHIYGHGHGRGHGHTYTHIKTEQSNSLHFMEIEGILQSTWVQHATGMSIRLHASLVINE